jgi:NAD-dependent deacetylase
MKKPKLVFLTGAGISAESGLQTFRDSKDGLWNNFKIEEVCSTQAWEKNPEFVLNFYNERRKECLNAQPNLAHQLIAQLEKNYEVVVITQNVDNLHERAGSTKVIHLHGELMKVRSNVNSKLVYDREGDVVLGEQCEQNSQLRPHIVFFGDELDESLVNEAIKAAVTCSVFIIVGTSMQVSPANSLPYYVPFASQMVVIDPLAHEMDIDNERSIYYMSEKATVGMQQLYEVLNTQNFQNQEN